MYWETTITDQHVTDRTATHQDLDRHLVALGNLQHLRQTCGDHDAVPGQRHLPHRFHVEDSVKLGRSRDSRDGELPGSLARSEAGRDVPGRFGRYHARKSLQGMNARGGYRFNERQLHILPLGEPKLNVHHQVERVEGERSHDQYCNRQGDSTDRDQRAHGLALDIAHDDPCGLGKKPAQGQALHEADPVRGGRFRPHGLGRLQRNGLPHSGIRTEDRGHDPDDDAASQHLGLKLVGEHGKPEERVVHPQHLAREKRPAGRPCQRSEQADG